MKRKGYIIKLYKQYEKEKPNTDKFNELLRKSRIQRDELEKTLKHKQRKQLQKLMEITYDMWDEENRQFFKEGMAIPLRIMSEALRKTM